MSGSRTTRILALIVLLLAAAPLGSLYYICFSFISTGIYHVPSSHMLAVPLKTIATTTTAATTTTKTRIRPNISSKKDNPLHHPTNTDNINNDRNKIDPFMAATAGIYVGDSSKTTTTAGASDDPDDVNYNSFHYHYQSQHQQHVSILLPWILSLILGVIIPSGLSIYSFLLHTNLYRQQQEVRRRRQQQQNNDDNDDWDEDESEEQRTRRREKRLHTLLKQLQNYTLTLSENNCYYYDISTTGEDNKNDNDDDILKTSVPDLVNDDNSNNNVVTTSSSTTTVQTNIPPLNTTLSKEMKDEEINIWEMETPTILWKIPNPGVAIDDPDYITTLHPSSDTKRTTSTTTSSSSSSSCCRTISSSCAICLSTFEYQDVICWSSNPNCIHVFHETCIVSWLLLRLQQLQRQQRYEQQQQQQQREDETPKHSCPCCRQSFVVQPNPTTVSNN